MDLFAFGVLIGEASAWLKCLRYQDALSVYRVARYWFEGNDHPVVREQISGVRSQIAALACDPQVGTHPFDAARKTLEAPLSPVSADNPIPHFVSGGFHERSRTIEIWYLIHDPAKHQKDETAFAYLDEVVASVTQRSPNVAGLLASFPAQSGIPSSPDSNYVLFMQAVTTFGLPCQRALEATHLGTYAGARAFELQSCRVHLRAGVFVHFAMPHGGR